MNATADPSFPADVISATAEYVAALFRDHSDQSFPFHNYRHTTDVVRAALEIGRGENLSDEELEIVTVAAWLHDVGYFQVYTGHEEQSAETARRFLPGLHYPPERVEKVVGCILATRYPQQPRTLAEQVICDADMAHLGGDSAPERSESLRRERLECCNERFDDPTWLAVNLKFMRSQRYHTETARRLYEPKLREHIRRAEDELAALAPFSGRDDSRNDPPTDPDGTEGGSKTEDGGTSADRDKTEEKEKGEKKDKKIKKLRKELLKIQEQLDEAARETDGKEGEKEPKGNSAARLDRGIETMFRTTSRNHIDLSAMADSKANILISVNSIVISIVASLLLSRLDKDPEYIAPTAILLCVCLATIISSILATRPKVNSGTFTRQDIADKKVNLLFFGNFHSVSLEHYREGVTAMMNDSDYLYGSMIKDIYFLGRVLGNKYRLLRISYNIFMYGLVLAVLAFIVAAVIDGLD